MTWWNRLPIWKHKPCISGANDAGRRFGNTKHHFFRPLYIVFSNCVLGTSPIERSELHEGFTRISVCFFSLSLFSFFSCSLFNCFISREAESFQTSLIHDPTLQVTPEQCPRCGAHETVSFMADVTSKSEQLRLIYICRFCDNRWMSPKKTEVKEG